MLSRLDQVFHRANDNNNIELLSYEELAVPQQCEDPFRLGQLPIVAMGEVIKIMTISERTKLALLSKKMQKNVSRFKYKMENIEIHIRDELSNVYMEKENFTMFCGRHCYRPNGGEILRRRDLEPWILESNTLIENIKKVFEHVLGIIDSNSFGLSLYLDNTNCLQVSEVLEDSNFGFWKMITIYGEKIDKRLLDLIMDKASNKKVIAVENTFPEDYHHENAFIFHSIFYIDARWVRVENLFSLKNSQQVYLGKNTLTWTAANIFIKHWIESECDMFETLSVRSYGRTRRGQRAMFNGVVVLTTFQNEKTYFWITSNPSKIDRKQTILSVFFTKEGLCFVACSPEDPENSRKFSILTALNRKKLLEKEVEDIGGPQNHLEYLRKDKLLMEIQQLMEQLQEDGVFYVNGRPVLQPIL